MDGGAIREPFMQFGEGPSGSQQGNAAASTMDSHRYTDTSLQYADEGASTDYDGDDERRDRRRGRSNNSSAYNSTNRTSTLPLQQMRQ